MLSSPEGSLSDFRRAATYSITGGAGKLAGIQGMARTAGSAEPKANINETQAEIQYSLGK